MDASRTTIVKRFADTLRWGAYVTFFFGLVSLPVLARAYTAEALAQYQAGGQYQKARQWRPAVLAFEAALAADPTLTASCKALGAIYYEMGEPKGALYFYDRYLLSYPGDSATQKFVRGLKASLGIATASPSPVPSQGSTQNPNPLPTLALALVPSPAAATYRAGAIRNPGPFNPGFDLRLPLDGVMASNADIDTAFAGEPVGAGNKLNLPGTALAWGMGLGVDYGLADGFVGGLDLLYGPNRSPEVSESHYQSTNGFVDSNTGSTTINVNQLSMLLTPGWRFKMSDTFILEPRLGLGLMYAMLTQGGGSGYGNSGSSSAAGLGFAIWPEIRAERMFGQFGLGLSVGYLYNTPTTMNYTSVPSGSGAAVGSTVRYQTASGSMANWTLSTSGLSFAIYGVWHFQPLF